MISSWSPKPGYGISEGKQTLASADEPGLQLLLRPTIINDRPLANDFAIIWKSDAFGENRVGRVRLANEQSWKEAEQWEWMINPPMPVPPRAQGLAPSRDLALLAF